MWNINMFLHNIKTNFMPPPLNGVGALKCFLERIQLKYYMVTLFVQNNTRSLHVYKKPKRKTQSESRGIDKNNIVQHVQ